MGKLNLLLSALLESPILNCRVQPGSGSQTRLQLQVRVLLCSIKAASLGLNLTMAHKVILLDCWWNAATEEQVCSFHPSLSLPFSASGSNSCGGGISLCHMHILHLRAMLIPNSWQAVDRCHRLGQTKDVGVVKLVMRLDDGQPTVEERIINMQVFPSSDLHPFPVFTCAIAHLSL